MPPVQSCHVHKLAMLYLSAFLGLVLWLYHDVILDLDVRRYNGTSSSAITYANLSATMMILSLYYLFQQKTQSVLILISFVIFVFLYSETETRGPIIGLLVATIYLTFSLRVRPEGKAAVIRTKVYPAISYGIEVSECKGAPIARMSAAVIYNFPRKITGMT